MRTKKYIVVPLVLISVFGLISCSGDSAEKIRYEMEKMTFAAQKLSTRINIQPELSTAADSLSVKSAYQSILDYYYKHKDLPAVLSNVVEQAEMAKMAILAERELALYFASHGQADSVIAAYRAIGTRIPAEHTDIAGATLALAMTYRAIHLYDSTLALYEKLLRENYPPMDSLRRLNTDLLTIPIDIIRINRTRGDSAQYRASIQKAAAYYRRLQSDYPRSIIYNTACLYAGRVHTISGDWDKAIEQFEQVKDSTGQIDIAVALLIANIQAAPKNNPAKAVDLYRQILSRHPDSSTVGVTLLHLGTALCAQKRFQEGRQVLAELKKKYKDYPLLISKAQSTYARAFAAEGDWDRAIMEFQWLMDNYPYSEDAFKAAFAILDHFIAQKDEKMKTIWYQRAIDFFQKVANNNPDQLIALTAYSFMAEAQRRFGKPKEAIETLDKILSISPQSLAGAKALYSAANIAYNELHDPSLAQSYRDRLRKNFGTTDSTAIHRT